MPAIMRTRDRLAYGHTFFRNAARPGAPRILYVEVTKRCNAFCGFCPYWQTHRRDELTDYAPIVSRLKPFCVTFTGGEPLLRRDMPELVRRVAAVRPKPYTALLTNGWLLSLDKARALREAGLEQISISLDYVGEAHDVQRGLPGLYRRIADRIPQLKALGYDRLLINTVIMESNLDHVVELAKITASWGILHSFSAYSTLKTDSASELIPEMQLKRLEKVISEIKRLKRKERHIISSDFYLDRVVPYFRNGGKIGEKCESAGRRFYHIDPWGYAKICPEFDPFAHWTEMDWKRPEPTDCTKCWYGCRGENEAPLSLSRLRDLRIG